MDSAQQEKRRFANMAEDYDKMAPYLLPKYAFLQEEMIALSQVLLLDRANIVDLGAGSGIFLERVLERHPAADAWWVDSSSAFLDVARGRLERFGDRVRFVLSTLEEDWDARIDRPVDCIYSMSAIHHLENDEKYRLYGRCFELLRPGGWLINTDEMKTSFDDAYLASLQHWVRHVDASTDSIPSELQTHAERWRGHFAGWKRRNIEGISLPKAKGDDMHEHFVEQMNWLKQIGFANVDTFVKYHLWCMVGGRRPGV